ncbi:MAG: YARHG domain-containing protein [Treponema sp.]|jgi:hypothetical protein|nr:YARHG domain-containing protein [Treponema sp.]
MNKEKLFAIFFLAAISHLPAADPYDAREYLEYISFGFDAVITLRRTDMLMENEFYMLNNPLYSNMTIRYFVNNGDSSNPFSIIMGTEKYYLMEGYIEHDKCFLREWPITDALKHYYDRYQGGYTGPDGAGMMYETDKNGRMISARYIHQYRESETPAYSVRYFKDGSVALDFGYSTVLFQNIPQQELTDIYLTAFTKRTRIYLEKLDDETLLGRTKEELAIIRNIIFAKYNYDFQSPKWKQFMIKYYDKNYKGSRSNQAVMNLLNDSEKNLLEKIIEYEKR